ncbi:DUF3846 domain-containing protein [Ruminococcus sp.]|uniref:DUF3846 domain-containing protein n=1 Tax=Ruminococcus sp. TaxID=41978 RepID=UPI0039A03F8A
MVDGYIEPLYDYLDDSKALAWGNEEARICEMRPNRKFDGKQAICGTFFITGDNGEDSLSLTENQVKKYLEMFKSQTDLQSVRSVRHSDVRCISSHSRS